MSVKTPRSQARAVLSDLWQEHPEIFGPKTKPSLLHLTERARDTPIEALVLDLVRLVDGPKRDRFERAIQRCIDAYVWPSGAQIRAEIARETGRGGTETLSGDEARWRRDYLVSKGWSCQDFGRFKPPEAWSAISKVQAADRRARAKRKAREDAVLVRPLSEAP